MATKEKKPADTLMEDPAELVTDDAKAPEPGTMKEDAKQAKQDAKDKRIAELEARLAEAEKLAAAMTKGDDFKVVQQKSQECADQDIDPWGVTVSIRVPARRDSNDPYYWLCVNGRSVQIPANNEYQEMKLPFAEALVNMLRAERHAQNFADEEIQIYDPKTNPHEKEDIRK